jgi:phenylalanyl-tRNA synthetase beta chain
MFGSAVAGGVPAMKLANPLDPAAAWMRTSLWPGLLDTAHRNHARGLTDLALFEIGTVFRPEPGREYGSGPLPSGDALPEPAVLQGLRDSIPPQPWHVAGLFVGDAVAKQPGQPSVARGLTDALDSVARLAAAIAVDIRPVQGSHQALHPGRTAELRVGDRLVGWAGELLPSIAAELDLPRVVAVFELDLDAVIALAAAELTARPIRSMPAATQDVSLVVPVEVTAGQLHAIIVEGAGELLEHARLVDDYRGAGVPEGSKSLTFALRFRAPDRTLTAAEATESKQAAVALAASRVGATLRE